ncbi:MAG: Fe-S cluster assembly protein SufD [Methylomonas sp.]|nr:Fe-S cluster assembly protein SufD [Methylomonas sp.]PPD19297.1 MAG: Fe-S cluster assembly protein SufD [Methylomonas sp.]PPD37635.1 MAG: Fe-S cluster assembly protein SufD [Methylomonas sp.]PPD52616.1 MAG: Fe-S cluster assembly protein SufD [Methylomonas sp.]
MIAADHSAYSYLTAYQTLVTSLPGRDLPWLQQLRGEALQAFAERGFPGVGEEDWRYTALSVLNKTVFAPVTAQQVDLDWLNSYRLDDAACAVLVNGRFSSALSVLNGWDGVTVSALSELLADNPAVVETMLGQAVTSCEHNLVAFNNAWFADGVVVRVVANAQIDKPLQILHVVTDAQALAVTRNLFVVNDHADIEIIETYIGINEAYFTAAINEVLLGCNADLTLSKVQLEGGKAQHFGGTYVRQAPDSRFAHHNFALGGLLARSDIHSDLAQASECTLNGLFVASGRQHLDNHTRINHAKPHGISREFYKGVLDQRARGVFQGRVIVAEHAQHTDSEMNNRNLLLSSDAEVDTKPQLEIYADDVKCSHGVTVGQLEDKSVFYLQSRGVDEATARNILTFAFANEMVDKVENAELKSLLLKELLVRFPAMSL